MTNAEIEATLDKLIEITQKMADDLSPLVKATHEKFVPEERPLIDGRADAFLEELRQLRLTFDKNRGTSHSVPVLIAGQPGFQTEVKS